MKRKGEKALKLFYSATLKNRYQPKQQKIYSQ